MPARLRTAALLVVSTFVLAACGGTGGGGGSAPAARSEYPMTVENCGRQVTFDKPPQRVVALGEDPPVLLEAAGGASKLVAYAGRTDMPFGKAATAVQAAELLAPASNKVSLERIVAEKPDLVITYLDPRELDSVGIKALVPSSYCEDVGFPPASFSSVFELIYGDVETWGRVLGTSQAAAASVADFRKRVAAVQQRVAGRSGDRTVAFFMYADKTPAAYGGRAIISEQMRIVGLENVFGQTAKRYFEPSVEEIIATNPERIIALYTSGQSMLADAAAVIQNLRDRPALAGIDAIRTGAIIPLNYNYSSPSPLAVDGLEQLANQLVGAR